MIDIDKLVNELFCSEEQYLNTVYALREQNKLHEFFELPVYICNKMSDADIRRLYHVARENCFAVLTEDVHHAVQDAYNNSGSTAIADLYVELNKGRSVVVQLTDQKYGKIRLELIATLSEQYIKARLDEQLKELDAMIDTLAVLMAEEEQHQTQVLH